MRLILPAAATLALTAFAAITLWREGPAPVVRAGPASTEPRQAIGGPAKPALVDAALEAS